MPKPRSDGAKIRKARRERGIKSATLADRVGIARQTLYNVESNDAALSIEYVQRAADILGCPVEDLLRDTEREAVAS
ncbi:MAG TPA: helix-turn-helix transcriptional regulator [Mycobacteriales bacterium]|jgi:Predicted transcriptional regulators